MEINIDTIHCRPRRGPDHFQAPSKGATRSVAERRSRILGGSGFASNDEGVKRVLDDFDLMRDRSKDGVLVTSDVSGMDFSLGGLALLAAYHAILCKSQPSESFDRAAVAYAYLEAGTRNVVRGLYA